MHAKTHADTRYFQSELSVTLCFYCEGLKQRWGGGFTAILKNCRSGYTFGLQRISQYRFRQRVGRRFGTFNLKLGGLRHGDGDGD